VTSTATFTAIARTIVLFTRTHESAGSGGARCLTFSSDLVPILPSHGAMWYLSSCDERGPEFRRRQLHKRK
jgi:hypothetical protein